MTFQMIMNDGNVFTLPRESLIAHSDFFRVKFDGTFKDSEDDSSSYDSITSAAFRPIFQWLTGGGGLPAIFANITVSDLEASLAAADFFRFEDYEREMKRLLLGEWYTATRFPLEMLECAKRLHPDKREILETSCVRLAGDLLTAAHRASAPTYSPTYSPETSYGIVLHAASNLFQLSEEENVLEDFRVNHRVGSWLLKNHALTADQVYELLRRLRLEVNSGAITHAGPTNADETRMWHVVSDCKNRLVRERREKISRLIDEIYIQAKSETYDYNLIVCTFATKLWFWQLRGADLGHVCATHFVNRNAYVFMDRSQITLGMESMTSAVTILQNSDYAAKYGEIFYPQSLNSVLTCNQNFLLYFVPVVPCGYVLQYHAIRKEFVQIPDGPYSEDTTRTWDVLVHEGTLYLACLNSKKSSKTLEVYKLDPFSKTYTLLCRKKDLRGMPRKPYNPHLCLGVLGNVLYVVCFAARPTFYIEINLADSNRTADLRVYGNAYYDKIRTLCPPRILPRGGDGFLMTVLVKHFEERKVLVGFLKPRENVFELLGCLPAIPNFGRLIIWKIDKVIAA